MDCGRVPSHQLEPPRGELLNPPLASPASKLHPRKQVFVGSGARNGESHPRSDPKWSRQARNYQSAVTSASDTFFVAIQGRNSMSLTGYARVSTMETRQHLHRQLDALYVAGCERVFEDHASGADPEAQMTE